jgi:hypothetical protein
MKLRIPSVNEAVTYLRPNVKHWDLYQKDGTAKFLMWEDPTGSDPPSWEELSLQVRKDFATWEYYEYARKREELYGDIGDQLDMLYHDIKSGNLQNGNWIKLIDSVKEEIKKPESPAPDVENWTL